MLYMKRYAELLYTWGLTYQAIQVCKIVAKTDAHLQSRKSSKTLLATRVASRTIKDYLPFSEHSLGYSCDKAVVQDQHERQLMLNMGAGLCDSCSALTVRCSICNLNV